MQIEAPKSGAAASLCAILRRVAALSSFLRSLLTAPFGKKIRQQFLAFKSQNAARHHRTMIDAGNVKKPKGTLESAAPAVACAVDNTAAPCLGNGARTHWTRFKRDVKRRVGEPMIGEGGSGGALALAAADRVYMLENAVFSVISPEGCASILWEDASKAADAAECLKITAEDMKRFGVAEDVIEENFDSFDVMCEDLKARLLSDVQELEQYSGRVLSEKRYERFRRLGVYSEK